MHTGHGNKRQRLPVHRASRRETDGPLRQRRQHYPHCKSEWQRYQQGVLPCFPTLRTTLMEQSGLSLDLLQHLEISNPPDDAQHGMRARA